MSAHSPESQETKYGAHRFLLVNRTMSRNFEYIADNDASGNKDKPPAFVASMGSSRHGKPDMTLLAGPDDKSSHAVACAYRPGFSRTFRIGLGDAIHAKDHVTWGEMKYESFFSKTLLWTFNLPSGKSLRLKWSPTSHHAVDGKKPSRIGGTNWKLVDANGPGDTILSVFTGRSGPSRTCGTLQINVNWGRDFDYLVLMTVVAMYDKVKRTRRTVVNAST